MMRLTSRASELFLQQPAAERRRLLGVVLENAAWKDGELRMSLFEPFEILRRSNRESYRKHAENPDSGRYHFRVATSISHAADAHAAGRM
jgi:hypothetical protein